MYGSTPDQINQVERHRRQNDGVSKSEHLYYIDNGVLLLVFHPDVVECVVLEVLTIEIELPENKSPFKSMIHDGCLRGFSHSRKNRRMVCTS